MKHIEHYRIVKSLRDRVGRDILMLQGGIAAAENGRPDMLVEAAKEVLSSLQADYASMLLVPGHMAARIAVGPGSKFKFGQHDTENTYLNVDLPPGTTVLQMSEISNELQKKAEALAKAMNEGCRSCPSQTEACGLSEEWVAYSEPNLFDANGEEQERLPDAVPEGKPWTLQVMILKEKMD